jgi:hypothetical protein
MPLGSLITKLRRVGKPIDFYSLLPQFIISIAETVRDSNKFISSSVPAHSLPFIISIMDTKHYTPLSGSKYRTF